MTQPLDLAALEARVRELETESAALTKALTGLTCNGSEFFIRKGDRYVADIEACVAWITNRDRKAHRREIALVSARKAADARITDLEAHLHRANHELEVLKELHFGPSRGPQDQGGGE